MSDVRFAVYFTPAPDAPLARFGAAALGYDCVTGEAIPQLALAGIDPAQAARAAIEPARYGFHPTLMAPFELADGRSAEELAAAIDTVAASRSAVSLGLLKVASIGRFVALVPAGPQDAVAQLAADCLHAFDRFRAPISRHDRERRLASRLTGYAVGSGCRPGPVSTGRPSCAQRANPPSRIARCRCPAVLRVQ